MFGFEVTDLLIVASLAVEAAWLLRLWTLCLSGRYKGLATYLIVSIIWSVFAYGARLLGPYLEVGANGGWSLYGWFFVLTRPLVWVVFFAVLYECYDRMVGQYPGVQRAGRLAFYTAIAAGVGLICWLALNNPEQVGTGRYWFRFVVGTEESVYLAAAGAVLLLALFRRFFSLPLPGNVSLIFGVFGVHFLGTALLLSVRIYEPFEGFAAAIRLTGYLLYLGCLLFGVVRFSPLGEGSAADLRAGGVAHAKPSARSAERHLQNINDQLARALHA